MIQVRRGARTHLPGSVHAPSAPGGRAPFALCLIAASLLSACGHATVTLKPGASPDAMAADEKQCRAASDGDASFEKCMSDRGYLLAGKPTPTRQENTTGTPKSGASPEAMAADAKQCRAASNEDASFETCMRDRGYLLAVKPIPSGAGNATVTLKPGASPDAIATDEKQCRDASDDDASFEKCMRDRGYLFAGKRLPGVESVPNVAH